MLDYLQSLMSFGKAPVAGSAGATNYSTLAPASYIQEVQAQPGFLSLGSGGLPAVAATQAGQVAPSFLDGMLGYSDANGFQPGWGGAALGALQGIGNAYMGMKQYGLAEDALKEQKRQFDINYGAQKKAFNSQIEDRQNARNAANPGAYDDTPTYMKKYGL